jgi:hypothetical protein
MEKNGMTVILTYSGCFPRVHPKKRVAPDGFAEPCNPNKQQVLDRMQLVILARLLEFLRIAIFAIQYIWQFLPGFLSFWFSRTAAAVLKVLQT